MFLFPSLLRSTPTFCPVLFFSSRPYHLAVIRVKRLMKQKNCKEIPGRKWPCGDLRLSLQKTGKWSARRPAEVYSHLHLGGPAECIGRWGIVRNFAHLDGPSPIALSSCPGHTAPRGSLCKGEEVDTKEWGGVCVCVGVWQEGWKPGRDRRMARGARDNHACTNARLGVCVTWGLLLKSL